MVKIHSVDFRSINHNRLTKIQKWVDVINISSWHTKLHHLVNCSVKDRLGTKKGTRNWRSRHKPPKSINKYEEVRTFSFVPSTQFRAINMMNIGRR